MGEATYKVEGGKLIKISLKKNKSRIQQIKITGDFFLHPEEFIEELEEILIDKPLQTPNLSKVIKDSMRKGGATFLGASPEDFEKCILMASAKNE